MIEQVTAAFDRQDYQAVARLLKALPAKEPWVQLYQGRLYEATDQAAAAEAVYRQLLKTATGPKITAQARQGLQRLDTLARKQQQLKIAQATANPADAKLGLMVLEPVPPDTKSAAAQKFARVMKVDPYAARLHLPSQGWRLYRTGPVGELKVYGQALQAEGIPVFWFPVAELEQIQVTQVSYFEANAFEMSALQANTVSQVPFTFQWREVTQRVVGLLPLFEQVVDFDVRGKLQRKEKIQDHAQICDLHLPSRNCILRLYDSGYQFQRGIDLTTTQSQIASQITQIDRDTSWANWQYLSRFLSQSLPETPVWSGFKFFAETSLEHLERLDLIEPHINLFRRVESVWDQSFHLYSCLVFLRNKK